MGKEVGGEGEGDISIVVDVEEGEISDDDNQQEINDNDDKVVEEELVVVEEEKVKEEEKAKEEEKEEVVTKPVIREESKRMVWTMEDLFKYNQVFPRNFATPMYNYAWKQAVQNRPLRNVDEDNINAAAAAATSVVIEISDEGVVVNDVGSEKEEGEIEEGEIGDNDTEMVEGTVVESNLNGISSSTTDDNENEEIKSIRQVIQLIINAKNVGKPFGGACGELWTSLDKLQKFVLNNGTSSSVNSLIQQSFAALQAVKFVYCTMNFKEQTQYKDVFSRLLVHVKTQNASLFSSEQMEELEDIIQSLEKQKEILEKNGANQNDHEANPSLGMNRIESGIVGKNPLQEKNGASQNGHGENPHLGTNRIEIGIVGENPPRVLNSSKKSLLEPISVKHNDQSNVKVGSGIFQSGPLSGLKSRGGFGPLLDLHMDHDVDDLPSPTRDAPKPFLIHKPQVQHRDHGMNRFPSPSPTRETLRPVQANKPQAVESRPVKSDGTEMHPYETDAHKAVSTYQQKFGQTSLLQSTLLPSPTPSEEGNEDEDDLKGEVSSSSVSNGGAVNPSVPLQAASVYAAFQNNGPCRQGTEINPVVAQKQSRGRDPRRDPRRQNLGSEVGSGDLNLRSAYLEHNPPTSGTLEEIINTRKNKSVPESVLDGHTLKRQRNGLTRSTVSGTGGWGEDTSVRPQPTLANQVTESVGSRDPRKFGNGGWSEDSVTRPQPTLANQVGESIRSSDPRKFGNGEVVLGQRQDNGGRNLTAGAGGQEQLSLIGNGNMGSLPSPLKDIAVNPMLISLLLEHQRLQKSNNSPQNLVISSSLNGFPGSIPLANIPSSKSSDIDKKYSVKPQVPGQAISTGDSGKTRMKLRDPRLAARMNTCQKNESLGPLEQLKTFGAPSSLTQDSRENLIVRQQSVQAQTNSVPSGAPDIFQQFTKELKSLADILSASQAPSVVPLTVSSPIIPVKTETTEMKTVVTESKDQESGTVTAPVERIVQPTQNTWGDVEHLLEGYDDQERAAIHKERARRMEEQNKMFAARKLCLILDLDHTLLNSAKFVEVDPIHEEVLRKKEEQDREKPHRHLFRFPHMRMWTKLRPGVWNFLEKASKLYELHLYTMGNKLYATEMAKVLDPSGALFEGRVISKGDEGDPYDGDERPQKIKDLEGVLGMESNVVIIDDSVRVWPHNKLNLIVVERYTYFPCSRRQFGLMGPSLLEIDHDERPDEGTLALSLAVIERVHQNFFSHKSLNDLDVRSILAAEQRKILAGCRIVFSRIFPVGEMNPQLHPLWQSAEQFGAVCSTQIDEHVTHVVANSLGTDKVNWALNTGRYVVHPGWVEASTLLYRRANEHEFAVKI